MPYQVHGALLHAMCGTKLSRLRTELRLLRPEPINQSLLVSRGAGIVMQSSEFLLPLVHALSSLCKIPFPVNPCLETSNTYNVANNYHPHRQLCVAVWPEYGLLDVVSLYFSLIAAGRIVRS